MLITQTRNALPIASDGAQPRPVVTRRQAEKIVNIAGIETGQRVLHTGLPDGVIKAAIEACGGRFIIGGPRRWPMVMRNRADAALCCIDGCGAGGVDQALAIFRQHLRIGGRWVLWAVPDNHQPSSIFRNHLLKAAATAGFTSLIVGQLPSDTGNDIVVATGVRR